VHALPTDIFRTTMHTAPSHGLAAASPFVVGVDLVSVREIGDSIDRFGARYVERLFTPAEIAYCAVGTTPAGIAERYAARFAAKEAAFKALRYGDRATDWRSVEVVRAPEGWCDLVLHGQALAVAREAGVGGMAVSMSHDGEYAMAVVTAWRSEAS
jgi:holo-[acyl-carrier protein] synthase